MIVIETPRLALRRFTLEDAEFILRLLNEPSFLQFIGDKGVRTLDDARDYLRKGPIASYEQFGFGLYLTTLKRDGTAVGMCGLLKRESLPDVDIGFAFLPEFWSQGYGLEAAAAVLSHGRKAFSLDRIVAVARPENHASIRLLEKLGMKYKKRVKLAPDGPEDVLMAIDFPRG